MKRKRLLLGLFIFDIIAALLFFAWYFRGGTGQDKLSFDGDRAFQDVETQVNFGPRIPGSDAHKQVMLYIQSELLAAGWQTRVLEQQFGGRTAFNILASRNSADPIVLLGAHYDSRLLADNDPSAANRNLPVPGANDGASGVAVLLEIARTLPADSTACSLLFIDIEDNGRIPGWDWILGSRAFASELTIHPQVVVIVDMIGDSNLNIYKEQNSDPELTTQIWETAKKLGYESSFIPQYKYKVLDDHIPFLEKNIRSVDIIDLDYEYWHTIQDTPDKVSAESLEITGKTLLRWLQDYGPCIEQKNCNEK